MISQSIRPIASTTAVIALWLPPSAR